MLPKMIMFDYGRTLLYEPGHNMVKGTEAVLRHAVHNPDGLSAQQICVAARKLHDEVIEPARSLDIELREEQFMNLLYTSLKIQFNKTWSELERIYWDGCSEGARVPNVEAMLSYLNERSIRTAVVSNALISGETLAERINRLLPQNRFEFILASSDYGIRKPHPLIFKLALSIAKLEPKDSWFCGDDIRCDVLGASKSGLFPVWYNSQKTLETSKNYNSVPECSHTQINDWAELISILETL